MRLLKGLLVTLASLVVLLGVALGVLIAVIDEQALVDEYRATGVDALEEALGRDVEVAEVGLAIWPTLSLEATGIEIAAAEGAAVDTPLLTADALRLEIDLATAVFSLGEEIEVEQVVALAPRAHVERAADGTLSYQDIVDRFAARADESPSEPLPPRLQALVQDTEVSRLALQDGEVTFVDRAAPGDAPATVTVRAIDAEALDLALGRTIQLDVRAAVGDETTQDVHVTVHTTALPGQLPLEPAPELREVLVEVDEVALDRFSAFLPPAAAASLRGARLAADVSLAPREDQLVLGGELGLRGLRVEDEAGRAGAPFDVTLRPHARLAMDGSAVTLDEDAAVVLAGQPIALSGEVRELTTTPRLDGLRAEGRLDLTRMQDILPQLAQVRDAADVSGAAKIRITADGPVDAGRAEAHVNLSEASLVVPGQMNKPAGQPASLDAVAALEPERVRLERFAAAFGELRLDASGSVRTAPTPAADLTVTTPRPWTLAQMQAVLPSLREGVPAEGSVSFTSKIRGGADDLAVEVSPLKVVSGDSALSGRATVSNLAAPRVRFAVTSPRLDLDALMPKGEADAAAPAKPAEPVEVPEIVRTLDVAGTVRVDRGTYAETDFRDLEVDMALTKGRLTLTKAAVTAYDGRLRADGSKVDFTEGTPNFDVDARVEELEIASVLADKTSFGRFVQGHLGAQLAFQGRGLDADTILSSLTGRLDGRLVDGWIEGVDIAAKVLDPLVKRLKVSGGSLRELEDRGRTQFDRLRMRVQFVDGGMRLREPLNIETPYGTAHLAGRIAFSGDVDLDGDFSVAPSALARLSRNRVRPPEPIPVGLHLGCTLTEPCVEGLDVEPAAKVLASIAAKKAVDEGMDKLKSKAADAIEERLGEKVASKEALKERVRDEAKDKAKEKAKEGLKSLFGR